MELKQVDNQIKVYADSKYLFTANSIDEAERELKAQININNN